MAFIDPIEREIVVMLVVGGDTAHEAMQLPENSRQHPILLYGPDEMPGALGRLRPFIGNIGTTPGEEYPDSHNAGDFGQFLIGAEHDWGVEDEEALESRTDGHMDSNDVRTELLTAVWTSLITIYR